MILFLATATMYRETLPTANSLVTPSLGRPPAVPLEDLFWVQFLVTMVAKVRL
ncbi:hypothetical protein S7335_1468 [Synechococcus sp. PCC 7335]|nr:hypothetical protein S7335_1468 [Synechococcus sp. PCC 7335]